MKLIKKFILAKNKDKHSEKNSILKKIIIWFLYLILFWVISVIAFMWWLLQDLPWMDEIQNIQTSESTRIFDRWWELLYTIHWDENRKVIPFDWITNETVYAVIALEDEKFFNHEWVDFKGVLRAILWQLHIMSFKWWGSTITQQFVKNKFLTPERTYTRKLKEMILSLQIENSYTKQDIITMYLNQIPFWSNIYWIEQASKTFFWKDANHLSLAESAIIASIPNATTKYSPYWTNVHSTFDWVSKEEIEKEWIKTYKELIEKYWFDSFNLWLLPEFINTWTGSSWFLVPWRASHAIDKMYELWFIKEKKEVEKTKKELAGYEFQKFREEIKAPHFVMELKKTLVEKYWEEFLTKWWLKVYTTIDLKLQEKAEKLVKASAEINEEKYDAKNQALLSVDVKTWEILTLVWSRDFFDEEIDGQVNVMSQRRLSWSTFKPFAYLAMMMAWYSPSTIIFDVETDFWWNWANEYKPQNFDWKFFWPLTVRRALWNSRNITAIKAWLIWWIQKTYNIAQTLWIDFAKDADRYWASLPLWTADIKWSDLLKAYLVFANNGKSVELNSILKVVDRNWVVLEEFNEKQEKEELLDEEIAYLVTNMLADPSARWQWWNSRLQLKWRENAVKTWTSNKAVKKPWIKKPVIMPADWWVVWYTPQVATIVWSWNNDGSPMSRVASWWSTSWKTWYDFMTDFHKDLPVLKFEKPAWIKRIKISNLSWLLPSEETPNWSIVSWLFWKINTPKTYDNSINFVNIDLVSKKLPTEDTPESSIWKAAVLNLHSLRPNDSRWEDPVQKWLKNNSANYIKRLWIKELLAKVPTDFDDIHTAKNTVEKPEIKIISPKEDSKVSKNWFSIMPEINSKYNVIKVEYFLDWELVDTSYKSPFIWFIEIWTDNAIWSKHIVSTKIYDSLYNEWEASVRVKIWKDNQKPFTEIVKPSNNQEIIAWSSYEIKTLTYDQWSDIDELIFYLNWKKIWIKEEAPFSLILKVPEEGWENILKVIAFDKAWNKNSNSVSFISVEKEKNAFYDIKIEISDTLQYQIAEEIKLISSSKKLKLLDKIEFVVRTKSVVWDKINKILATIEKPETNESWIFYINWIPEQKWNYEVFIREYYKDKKKISGKKIPVIVK